MRFALSFVALPFFLSCAEDQAPGDESDADTDSDTDSDTDTDTGPEMFPVLAIGLDYRMGWDQNKGLTEYWCYPDGDDTDADPECYYSYAIVTLTTLDYFSLDPDDLDYEQQVDDETCEFSGILALEPGTFPAEGYDHDIPGGNGSTKTMWTSWVGTLDIDEKSYLEYFEKEEPECLNLDPTWFPTGEPFEYLNGMRIGIGFGETTEGLTYDDQKGWEEEAPFRFAVYTAINHPDGKGGVTFVGYDWSYAHLWNWDEEFVMTDEDDDGFLDPQDVSVPVDLSGVVFSNATWYEDFERNGDQIMDMSLMKQK